MELREEKVTYCQTGQVPHPEALASAWRALAQGPAKTSEDGLPRGTHLSKRPLVVARVRTFWMGDDGPPSEGLRQHLHPGGMVSVVIRSHPRRMLVNMALTGLLLPGDVRLGRGATLQRLW